MCALTTGYELFFLKREIIIGIGIGHVKHVITGIGLKNLNCASILKGIMDNTLNPPLTIYKCRKTYK